MIDEELYLQCKQEKEMVEDTLAALRKKYSTANLMLKYGTAENAVQDLQSAYPQLSERAALTIHAEIRYEPYIQRELKEVERSNYYQSLAIPQTFIYKDLPGLSKELQQKLSKHKPATIAQAALIPGMTPAALSLLIFRAREQGN